MNTGTEAWYMEMVVNGNPCEVGSDEMPEERAQAARAGARFSLRWACF
jgi:hypothetical protein